MASCGTAMLPAPMRCETLSTLVALSCFKAIPIGPNVWQVFTVTRSCVLASALVRAQVSELGQQQILHLEVPLVLGTVRTHGEPRKTAARRQTAPVQTAVLPCSLPVKQEKRRHVRSRPAAARALGDGPVSGLAVRRVLSFQPIRAAREGGSLRSTAVPVWFLLGEKGFQAVAEVVAGVAFDDQVIAGDLGGGVVAQAV